MSCLSYGKVWLGVPEEGKGMALKRSLGRDAPPRSSVLIKNKNTSLDKRTYFMILISGTQRQFLENICSEDDFKISNFRTFVENFLLASLSQDFRTSKKWHNCSFLTDF